MQDFDFVAIDCENATMQYDSACSLGIAAVRDMQVAETYYTLIAPPWLKFDDINIGIHGIKPEDVKNSPSLDEVWPVISKYFAKYAVLAHNAFFDMTVLKESLS